jgi:8-oxo-dGTP pyrophosphatase MutT (NUDIX family)
MSRGPIRTRYPDAAGVLVVARDVARYPGRSVLLSRRSRNVSAPLTWAPWGGRMERGESPAQTALREFREESGYAGPVELVGGSEWEHRVGAVGSFCFFRFTTHIGVVPEQFDPPGVPNWEVDDARWVSATELADALGGRDAPVLPGGLHPGLRQYLARDHVRALLADLCGFDADPGA